MFKGKETIRKTTYGWDICCKWKELHLVGEVNKSDGVKSNPGC